MTTVYEVERIAGRGSTDFPDVQNLLSQLDDVRQPALTRIQAARVSYGQAWVAAQSKQANTRQYVGTLQDVRREVLARVGQLGLDYLLPNLSAQILIPRFELPQDKQHSPQGYLASLRRVGSDAHHQIEMTKIVHDDVPHSVGQARLLERKLGAIRTDVIKQVGQLGLNYLFPELEKDIARVTVSRTPRFDAAVRAELRKPGSPPDPVVPRFSPLTQRRIAR